MSKLDDELAEAVQHSEDNATEAVVVQKGAEPKPKRNLALLIGLLVTMAAVLTLVMNSFEGATIYSKGVDELLKERDRLADRNVRVQGTLVKGTLVRREQPCEYRFEMEKNKQRIPVRYPGCVVPDTFKDVPGMDVEVTAEGKLASAGHFQATKIMAKCPSKYEMQQRAQRGESAPHEMNQGPDAANVVPASIKR